MTIACGALIFWLSVSGMSGQEDEEVLRNEDIIEMLEYGFGEEVVLLKIRSSSSEFDTSIDGLKLLKAAGATDSILSAILEKASKDTRVEPEGEISSECLAEYNDTYSFWLCDSSGRPDPDGASIVAFRRNRFGQPAARLVWSGSRDEWETNVETVIRGDEAAQEGCEVYLNVSDMNSAAGASWSQLTENMMKWATTDFRKEFPGFCLTSRPDLADYVILYSDDKSFRPYSISIPVPTRETFHGTFNSHDLRHKGASILTEQGIPEAIIRKLTGHRSVGINTYQNNYNRKR